MASYARADIRHLWDNPKSDRHTGFRDSISSLPHVLALVNDCKMDFKRSA